MHRLYVLYDANCPLCSHFRQWLVEQPQYVPVETVAAGSPEAHRLLPGFDHTATLREITVVSDSGQVWTGSRAWVVTLWATRTHRALAESLATPAGEPVAKAMAYAAAGLRQAIGPGRQPPAPRVSATPGGDYREGCDRACAEAR